MRKTVFASLIFLFFGSFAQELTERFKDEEVLFDSFISEYEYFFDAKTQKVKIKVTDKVTLVSSKTVNSFAWPVFYDDQVKILDFEVKNENGRKRREQKICGPIETSGIFYSDAKLCTYFLSFNIKSEKLIMTTTKVIEDPRYFTKINLQSFISGKKRVVKVKWPESIDVELRNFNFNRYDIVQKDISEGSFSIMQYEWNWADGFASDEENQVSTAYDSPHIVPITKGYIQPITKENISILRDISDLYGWYRSLISKVWNDETVLQELVEELIQGKSPEEQIEAIYYWVQDNIKYIAFENGIMGFQPDDAHSVYEKRYGDCKGMANLLKTMLSIAGFDARISWLGTSHIPYTYDVPSLVVDNHMICSVLHNDSILFLDATVKYNPLKYIPSHIQGKEILIESGDDFMLKKIPTENSAENFLKVKTSMTIKENKLKTQGTISSEGDDKQFFLYAYNQLWVSTKERFAKGFVQGNSPANDFSFEINEASKETPLSISFSNESEKFINEFESDLYIQMDIRNELVDHKIDPKRRTHFNLHKRIYLNAESTLEIPEGYTATFLPDDLSISTEIFNINLGYELVGQNILYKKKIEVNKTILPPSQFHAWNEALSKLDDFYQNPITLSYEK